MLSIRSSDKECLRWHWLKFRQPERKSSLESSNLFSIIRWYNFDMPSSVKLTLKICCLVIHTHLSRTVGSGFHIQNHPATSWIIIIIIFNGKYFPVAILYNDVTWCARSIIDPQVFFTTGTIKFGHINPDPFNLSCRSCDVPLAISIVRQGRVLGNVFVNWICSQGSSWLLMSTAAY